MKLVFSPTAYQDLQRLYNFMNHVAPHSLKQAAKRLRETFTMLSKYPLTGYPIDDMPGVRELVIPFGKGNYVIRYCVTGKALQVLHLWHNREEYP